MKKLFMVELEHLEVKEDLGRGDRIGDLLLTNSASRKAELLTPSLRAAMGTVQVDAFLRPGAVIAYSLDEVQAIPTGPESLAEIYRHLQALEIFSVSAWLFVDSTVNSDLGYLTCPHDAPGPHRVTRNLLATQPSSARSKFLPLIADREALRAIRELYLQLAPSEPTTESESFLQTQTRFARALYFVQAARASHNPAVKIANYASCLEALFSNDPSELSHKLGERIACFLETDPDKRLHVFRSVKKAYTIRSLTVHGSNISKKAAAEANGVAELCDALVRRVVRAIMDTTNNSVFTEHVSNETAEDFFLRLVFGGMHAEPEA